MSKLSITCEECHRVYDGSEDLIVFEQGDIDQLRKTAWLRGWVGSVTRDSNDERCPVCSYRHTLLGPYHEISTRLNTTPEPDRLFDAMIERVVYGKSYASLSTRTPNYTSSLDACVYVTCLYMPPDEVVSIDLRAFDENEKVLGEEVVKRLIYESALTTLSHVFSIVVKNIDELREFEYNKHIQS